jgi:hypothetical protein
MRNTSVGILLLHWDGHSWSRVPAPSPGTRYVTTMFGVSAFSPSNVWAVGYYYNFSTGFVRPLILHWNGKTVSEVPGPSGLHLVGVDAIGGISRDDVWAIGGIPRAGLLHWNGRAWSVRDSRACGDALGFVSPVDGWAVGAYGVRQGGGTLTCSLHWNGKDWAKVPSPDPGGVTAYDYLLSVSGSSASDVWAVGSSTNGTLEFHWNGTSWASIAPVAGIGASLSGVSALTRSDVWAVGNSPDYPEGTLTVRWNGSNWVRVPSPDHAGPNGTALNAVVALSRNDVWAVGNYGANGGVPQTWIIHWNGRSWQSS